MAEIQHADPAQLQEIYDQRWRILSQPADLAWGTQWDRYDDSEMHPETIHAIATEDDRIIGSGRIHVPVEAGHELRVRYMAVEPQQRGRQIGSCLLSFLEESAAEQFPEAKAIRLTARSRAVPLYERADYRAVSTNAGRVEMVKPLFVPAVVLTARRASN